MNTKLTLTIEKEIIDEAKKYASEKGKSLSEMVENYFKYLMDSNEKEARLSPKVSRLRGSIKVDEQFDYKKILEEERNKKHGF